MKFTFEEADRVKYRKPRHANGSRGRYFYALLTRRANATVQSSFGIERDEQTKVPYRVIRYHSNNRVARYRVADREAGALRRIAAICKAHGLHYYHQTDPRGCALYVSNEPLPDHNYTRGVACCA